MFVDFPFPNADRLGDLPGGHLFVAQKRKDLLANGLKMVLVAHGALLRRKPPTCGWVESECL